MATPAIPPCGIYRTTLNVAGIEAGRLVYFHNHGDPGPGLYLPESWAGNRAKFSERGNTVPSDFDWNGLFALPNEGFYRVSKEFFCCDKQCMKFETSTFVQLGYNANGTALVFVPVLGTNDISLPERGVVVDDAMLKHLQLLKLAEGKPTGGSAEPEINITLPRGFVVH